MNAERPDRPPIDPALQAGLLEAIAPLAPRRGRGAALKARILRRLGPPPAGPADFVTVHLHDGAWRRLAPKVYEKPLVDAAGLYARLLRLEPGASLPPHGHDSPEESVVLEGEVWLGEVFCVAGEFHFAPAGARHESVRTARGCLLYVRSGSPAAVPAPR